jgi:hypothetical protein
MPKGPKGENRPADVIGNAIKIARLATSGRGRRRRSSATPLTASHSGNLAFISESDTEIIVTSPLSRAKQVGIKITYSRDNT